MTEFLGGIDLLQLALIWAVVLLAAVLRSFTGFGFGLAAVPVFALFMAPTQAVVLSTSLTLVISLLTLRTFWGEFPLKPLLPMLAMCLLGTVFGAVVLSGVSPQQFRLWIGLCVIAACLVLSGYTPRHHEPGVLLGGVTGLASGVMNGAFAIPGPPVIIYAMATVPEPRRSRALLMTFFLFAALLALVTYTAAGFVTADSPRLFLLAFPAMLLGDKMGHWLFHKYGNAMYRRVALILMLGLGVAITARALL